MTYEEFEKRYQYDPQRDFLARGGFGAVYKAYDTVRKRYVAIKEASVDPSHKFSLMREVELSHEIEPHVNVVRYINNHRFTVGRKSSDYAVMPYFEHGNLNQVLARYPLSDADRMAITKGLLEGVAHLHKQSVIHRDLKASNILMEKREGEWIPKLTDFGISKLADTNASVSNTQIGLSIHYAAPEQLRNDSILPNVDLWAVGVSLYKVVMGVLPFDPTPRKSELPTPKRDFDTSAIAILVNKGLTTEQVGRIPYPYRLIIEKCLVVDKQERVKSAEELLDLLSNSITFSSTDDTSIIADQSAFEETREFNFSLEEDYIPGPSVEEIAQMRIGLRRIAATDTHLMTTLNVGGVTRFPLTLRTVLSTVEGSVLDQVTTQSIYQNGEIQIDIDYPAAIESGGIQFQLSLPVSQAGHAPECILVETNWYDWQRPLQAITPLPTKTVVESIKDNTGPTAKFQFDQKWFGKINGTTWPIALAVLLVIVIGAYILYNVLSDEQATSIQPQVKSAPGTVKGVTEVIATVGPYLNGVAQVTTLTGEKRYKSLQGQLYDEIRVANCGRIPVRLGNLWGYLNLNGEVAVKLHFDDAQSYDEEFCTALVTADGKMFKVDKWGVEVK